MGAVFSVMSPPCLARLAGMTERPLTSFHVPRGFKAAALRVPESLGFPHPVPKARLQTRPQSLGPIQAL